MTWYNETETGVTFERDARPEFAAFAEEWERATAEHRQKQFKIGDMWRFGERIYGERAHQALDVRQISRGRLSTYAWVCRKFSGRRRGWRRSRLSFYHHEAVAGLIDDPNAEEPAILNAKAKSLLDAAEELGLSVAEIEVEVSDIRGDGGEAANPLQLIQQARNLCEEAEPLVTDGVRAGVRMARSTLEDVIAELASDQDFERTTQAWFPASQAREERQAVSQ